MSFNIFKCRLSLYINVQRLFQLNQIQLILLNDRYALLIKILKPDKCSICLITHNILSSLAIGKD